MSGLSLTVATRDDELQSDGVRAWAALVHDDRTTVSLFLHASAAASAAALANLAAHPEIAVCVDRPSDNRSCQLKGVFTGSRKARAAERAEVQRQVDGFLAELEAIGIPRAMTEGWSFWPALRIDMRVTHLFEQTPGPGAGDPLPAGTRP